MEFLYTDYRYIDDVEKRLQNESSSKKNSYVFPAKRRKLNGKEPVIKLELSSCDHLIATYWG